MERVPLKNGTIIRFPDRTSYQIQELIGEGGSALVYEAIGIGANSGLYFAIKEIYPSEKYRRRADGEIVPVDDGSISMKAELSEMKNHILSRSARISQEAYRSIQQILPERNIFECAELVSPGENISKKVNNSYVVMDSLKEKGTPLQKYIYNFRRDGNKISLDYAVKIMEAILHTYSSLHEKGFIHGDCQMNNILLLNSSLADAGKSIVGVAVIDFGCGRKLEEDGKTAIIYDSLYSTDGYRAPEILRHGDNFRMSPACDIWSLGFLFLNFLVENPRWIQLQRILKCSDTPFGITEYLMENSSDKTILSTEGLNCNKAELHFANKILSHAMANAPEERYQNAGEMLLEMQALRRCISGDVSMGIDAHFLWNSSISWTANRAGSGLVRKIPSDKMVVYGQLGDNKEEPIVELLRKLGKQKNRNLYLHAPGGAGKSFAISELFNEYLENGFMVPLYLDMEKFTKYTLEQLKFGNNIFGEDIIPHLLAEQYFDADEADTERVGEQIYELLSNGTETVEYFLILDNLHKVKKDIYEYAIRTINHAHYCFRNTWVIVLGRIENPLSYEGINATPCVNHFIENTTDGKDKVNFGITNTEHVALLPEAYVVDRVKKLGKKALVENTRDRKDKVNFGITNTVHVALLPEAYVVDRVKKLRKKPLTKHDIDILKLQHETLGLPLFCNRYLEMLKEHSDTEYLPNGAAELLMVYFNKFEYDRNGRDIHLILTRHLPYVAYQYMLSEEGQQSIEKIGEWLQESYGKLRYRAEYLEVFLYECTNNLSVLNTNNSDQIYFIHDCYLDFFAAARIAEKTKEAIEEGDVYRFRKINHLWTERVNSIWPSLCVMEMSNGQAYKIFDEKELVDLEYELFLNNIERGKEYAQRIPSNVFEWVFSLSDDKDESFSSGIEWIILGAKFNDPYMEFGLASAYYSGSGVACDKKKSLFWMCQAAEHNFPNAQYILGSMYKQGLEVELDVEKAAEWFYKAAHQGDADAQYALCDAYAKGEGVPINKEQFIYWLCKAAEQGLAIAQNRLGYEYDSGEAIEVDNEKAVYWIRKAAEQGQANAQFNLACIYEDVGEYGGIIEKNLELAIYWYQKAAEQGNAKAQICLAWAYESGKGVEIDLKSAIYWYQKAAEQGDEFAQYRLGYAYEYGEGVKIDKKQAVHWYQKAAEQGDESAQYRLGYAYEYGEGIEMSKEKAVFWYRKAAEQGDESAQYSLGFAYDCGKGVEINKEQAAYWYCKAAEQGRATAQNRLGLAYFRGEGVKPSKEQAVYWYRKAAEQGLAFAQYNLGYAYEYGEGVKIDKEQAVHWYQKAAEQGVPVAQYSLGYAYDYGEGVDVDKEEAVYWYRKAAEQGHASAQYCLGYAYNHGDGVDTDKEQAVHWYRRAAEQGKASAQNILANLLYDGIGCEQDYKEALYWFAAAQQQGHISATNNLGWMYLNGHGMDAPDYDKAFALFTEAAKQGSKASHKHLGDMYIQGIGVPINLKLALEHYEKAKELGATNLDEQITQLKSRISEGK